MMKTCTVEGCRYIHYGKGFCKLHYDRQFKRGRKRGGGRPKYVTADHEPTAEEIEALVAVQSQCLPAWWRRVREPQVKPVPYERPVIRKRPNRRPSTVEGR